MQDYRAQILNPCARRIFSPRYKIRICEYSPPLLLASKSISAAAPLFSHSTQNPRIPHSAPLAPLRTQAACVGSYPPRFARPKHLAPRASLALHSKLYSRARFDGGRPRPSYLHPSPRLHFPALCSTRSMFKFHRTSGG